MRKSFFTLAPVALLLAFAGSAQAAANAQIDISGNVQDTTCDVRISTSALDLGNHKISDFTAAKTKVAASTKPFTLWLENCEIPTKIGIASMKVEGKTLAGHDDIFGEDSSATYGVVLNEASSSDLIKSGTMIEIADMKTVPTSDELSGKTLAFEASLAAPGASSTVKTSSVKAPIFFQFIYE